MRILLVLPRLLHTAPTLGVLSLARSLRSFGADVEVAALSDQGCDKVEGRFRSMNVPLHILGVTRARSAFGPSAVARFLAPHRYSIVHSTCLRPDVIVSRLCVRSRSFRTVSTVRSCFPEENRISYGRVCGAGLSWIWARALRRYDAVVAQSRGVRDALESSGVPSRLVRVVRSGIDLEGFQPPSQAARREARMRMGANEDTVVIGYVGRLAPVKRLDVIISAIDRLAERPPIVAAFVGDGKERDRLMRMTTCHPAVASRIRWLGHHDDVRPLLHAMDVFCMASATEGLPRALLEAGACAIPAVVPAISGCCEVVQSGVNGLLYPSGDSPALAAALRLLCDSQEIRRSMGLSMRARVEKHFSADGMATSYVELYQSLLRNHQ